MKKTLRKLRSLATLFLNEQENATINAMIKAERWNGLRIYLSDLMEELEIKMRTNQVSKELGLDEWLMLDEMEDIVMDIAIKMTEVNEAKPKRTRVLRE